MAYLSKSEIAAKQKQLATATGDICEHKVLRENCPYCPQPEKAKSPEELKIMLSCRNAVSRAFDAIERYNWVDPIDESKIDGYYMFAMLFKYSRKAWTPVQKVFVPNYEFKMATRTLKRCQRAAVEAGVLEDTGEKSGNKLYPVFVINFAKIDEFRKKDELTHEINQSLRKSARKHKKADPGDVAEELQIERAEDEEVASEDNEDELLLDVHQDELASMEMTA